MAPRAGAAAAAGRQAPAPAGRAASPPVAPATTPVPSALPAFQVIATTPVTGIGFDRNKVPAMVQTRDRRGFLARLFAQRARYAAAAHSRRHHHRRPGQRLLPGPALSRLRGLAAAGHAAGACRLHERHPHQRSLRRHRQLGLDPDRRHRPRRHLDQQSGVRPQRARRRDQLPDEGRLHLSTVSSSTRRAAPTAASAARCSTACAAASGGSISPREGFKDDGWRYQSPSRLARFYGDLGWKRHGRRDPPHHVSRRQLFRRGRPDAARAAQQRLSVDLHLAADHQKPGAAPRAQRPLLRDRPLDGAEQSLSPQVPAGPCRRQRCRRRALQRPGGQSAVQYAVPGGRRISDDSRGELPASQPEQSADQLPARTGQHLRHYALGHGRPHLDQRDDDRRARCRPSTTTRSSATTTTSPSAAASTAARSASKATASSATSIPISSSAPTLPCRERADHPHRRQYRLRAGQPRGLEYLLRHLRQRHLRHHQPAVGDCGRTLQHRPDRHGRSPRHQPRPQRPLHVRAVQSGGRASPTRSCRS